MSLADETLGHIRRIAGNVPQDEISNDEIRQQIFPAAMRLVSQYSPCPVQFQLTLTSGQHHYDPPESAGELLFVQASQNPRGLDGDEEFETGSEERSFVGFVSTPEIYAVASEQFKVAQAFIVRMDGGKIFVAPVDTGQIWILGGKVWDFSTTQTLPAADGVQSEWRLSQRVLWGATVKLDGEDLPSEFYTLRSELAGAVLTFTAPPSAGTVITLRATSSLNFTGKLAKGFMHAVGYLACEAIAQRRARIPEIRIGGSLMRYGFDELFMLAKKERERMIGCLDESVGTFQGGG